MHCPSYPFAEDLSDDDPEVKKTAMVGAVLTKDATVEMDKVFERFSSWHNLKKFVAWMLRYKANLRKPCPQVQTKPVKQTGKPTIQPITVTEMCGAERAIIKYVQQGHFKEEIESLKVMVSCTEESLSERPDMLC